jgi:putative iron-dependent peroxidase
MEPDSLARLAQPAILAAPAAIGRSLVFRLAPHAEPAIDPRGALAALRDRLQPDWGMVGIGEPLMRALGRAVPGLRTFPALAGTGIGVPSTQQAVWLYVLAGDRSTVVDRADAVGAALDGPFVLEDAMDTFLYAGGRDLTGYEDGTENPKGDDAVAAVLVADGAGRAGSSFVAVQRWVHDLARFRAHAPAERDAIIGRRREDNQEIEDAPDSAHVKRSAQEDYDPPAFMVRRSMPWSTGFAQGLEFVAYARTLDAYERVLRRMLGLDDGTVDALFTFSRPITGGYYWCPPLEGEKLDLTALGL